MKFYSKQRRMEDSPHKRVINYFAITPVTIDGETRWLEEVSILQKKDFKWIDNYAKKYYYENVKFVDGKEGDNECLET